jgi:hypothetical protein
MTRPAPQLMSINTSCFEKLTFMLRGEVLDGKVPEWETLHLV